MMAMVFLRGMLIGLVFGVPVGAVGALSMQRALARGFTAGLITGMGSSVADVLYAGVGVFGITFISDFLMEHQHGIQLIGGGLIVLFGISSLRKKEFQIAKAETKGTLAMHFLSAFSVAILNPATILSFMLVFSTFGLDGDFGIHQGLALIAGIFAGTLCWWTALSGVVAHFRNRVTERIFVWLNRALGCLMILFGAFMMLRGLLPGMMG